MGQRPRVCCLRLVFLAIFLLPGLSMPTFADRASAEKLAQEGLAAERQADRAKALDLLNNAVEADPTRPEVLALQGQVKNHTGDVLSAIDDYNRCIELDARRAPSDPTTVRDCKVLRGVALTELDRLAEAKEDPDWALKFDATDAHAIEGLALFYVQTGQIDLFAEQVAQLNQNAPSVVSYRLEALKLKADWVGLDKACLEVKVLGTDVAVAYYGPLR